MSKTITTNKLPGSDKENKPATPKRSLTPRRRAREYALQGVYQSLVMRRAGACRIL